jgi:inhibitor of cysteine peptidase
MGWGFALPTGCSSAAPLAESVALTEQDNNREINLGKGATLTIRLEAQLGTGYSWQTAKYEAEVLKPVGKPAIEKSETKKVGGVEHQIFRFRALKAGSSVLELHYVRPWQKDVPPLRIFRVTVQVR